MTKRAICTVRHLHHVCIAVKDIHETIKLYQDIFGLSETEVEEIEDQAVLAALIPIGGSNLEIIQPTDSVGGVARFIERRGEGMHHMCFQVENLQERLDDLAKNGIELIDQEPRQGLAGMIAFLHPRSTGGVLIELVDS